MPGQETGDARAGGEEQPPPAARGDAEAGGQAAKEPKGRRPAPPLEAVGPVLCKRLFHHHKEARKLAKKAQAFLLQRIIKRIRLFQAKCAEDQAPETHAPVPEDVRLQRERERARATEELELLKALDLERVAHAYLWQALASISLAVGNGEALAMTTSTTSTPPRRKDAAHHPTPEQAHQLRTLYLQVFPAWKAEEAVQQGNKMHERLLQSKTLAEHTPEMLEELGAIRNGTWKQVKQARQQRQQAAAAAQAAAKRKRGTEADLSLDDLLRQQEQEDGGAGWEALEEGAGSDAEGSDGSDHRPAKRNRPGQQARRALWERKYGEQARHVVQERAKVMASGPNSIQGPKAGRGAKGAAPVARKACPAPLTPASLATAAAPAADPSLHPSWAAKKAAKPVIQAFQGSKITFGDDDAADGANSTAKERRGEGPKARKEGKSTPKHQAPTSPPGPAEHLHPSWEAKRKAKESQEALLRQAPKATKIVFDN